MAQHITTIQEIRERTVAQAQQITSIHELLASQEQGLTAGRRPE